MESWKYALEGKGLLLSDGIDLPVDALASSRKVLMGWDCVRPSPDFDNKTLIPSREAVENMELGLPDVMRKSLPSNPSLGILGGEDSRKMSSPTRMIALNSFLGEVEPGSSLTSSVVSNNENSSLIDLKLGRLADWREANNNQFSRERSVLSSVGSSLQAKRARTASLCPQTPTCQVHGCNKDLSSSKDYHKRHKVCEVHSKTAKVIINGIEQRFCQQCSRFHLLGEFDDGKRSCRKRLAGHNERRRKPQLDTYPKSQELLQFCQGSRFLGTSLPKRTSFLFPEILPGVPFWAERYEQDNKSKHIKLEEQPTYSPQLAMPISTEQLLPKSIRHLHAMRKQCPSRVLSSETDYLQLDVGSRMQELSGASNSGGALSLLSSQSHNSSSHSKDIPTAHSLIIQAPHLANHSIDQNSAKILGINTLEKFAVNGFCPSGMSSMEVDQVGIPMVPGSSIAFESQVYADGIFHRPDYMSSKYSFSPETATTVDLLHLSSHLQRVEQQRNSVQVKQENDIFCCFSSTLGV